MRRYSLIFLLFPCILFAQPQPDAAHIKLKLKKLGVVGSVLYVAAHPDDENTRVITQLANDQLVETAYLSMTRGDGGQNLIGSEMRDLLGLIRTQELLAARRLDGGRQFFTRANDFGFSKSADETFKIWDKDKILSDVVRVYRQFQPDIIITRFPPDERAGHGHHTASAILAEEAFDLAARTDVYTDQLKEYTPWQVKRLYTNTGRWWNTTIDENTPGIVSLNVGGYNTLLGSSYSEIAAISRSQHKSQGFGSRSMRGDQLEFLERVKGDSLKGDLFQGIDITWSRIKGGEKIKTLVTQVNRTFDVEQPSASVPLLLQIRKEINALPTSIWKARKLVEVEQLLIDCMGLFISPTANRYWASPGESTSLSVEVVNRSEATVTLQRIESEALSLDTTFTLPLKMNSATLINTKKSVRSDWSYSDPYWLREPHPIGRFTVNDPALIGKPENDAAIEIALHFLVGSERLVITRPLEYRWTDPIKGECTRPVEVVPPVFINLTDQVVLFTNNTSREVKVKVTSAVDKSINGSLSLKLPSGWRAEPSSIDVVLSTSGEEQVKSFIVHPATGELSATLTAVVQVDGKVHDQALLTISYDHIPLQTLLPKAEARIVKIDLAKTGKTIGYIKGAGDDVPAALRNMGYEVWEMKNEEVNAENLKRVDAVVLGIRALNTNERIRFMMDDLLHFVEEGGNLVVQYNTSIDLQGNRLTPFPLSISRDRVTEEDAEVRILKPDHALLNYPNKITPTDFDGWIQERGLYFPNKWSENFDALLSMNDTGETPKEGSLLAARYGNGYYIYTGLSFFRELPEGVPGAYKLFANLVSGGKVTSPPVPEKKSKSKQKR